MNRAKWAFVLLFAVALVLLLVYGGRPSGEAKGTTNFGGVTTDADVTAGTYVDAATYADVGTFLILDKQTAVTVTAGSTITPTGSYQPITAASEVTTSTATAVLTPTVATGAFVFLVNTGANAITVDNGGNTALVGGADVVLGANDGLGLIWDGSDWVAVFSVDN